MKDKTFLWRAGTGSERDLAENIALAVKNDIPKDLAELRRFIEDGLGDITDKEFDELLVEIATRALRGESPEDWDT